MLFIDENSKIDKEALRQHVLKELNRLVGVLEKLIHGPENKKFWDGLHAYLATEYEGKDKDRCLGVERQIKGLISFIEGWVKTSVDSTERFEFFIQTKASEIRSGDEPKDYFWALQIRHDQLVALVKVLTDLTDVIKKWVQMKPAKVVADEEYAKLKEYEVEDRIFFEAEKINKNRKKMTE